MSDPVLDGLMNRKLVLERQIANLPAAFKRNIEGPDDGRSYEEGEALFEKEESLKTELAHVSSEIDRLLRAARAAAEAK